MLVFEVLGFKDNDTDIGTHDEMEKNPEYFAKNKRRQKSTQQMSPEEYINKAAKGFKTTVADLVAGRDQKLVDKYAAEMKSGDKFPTVHLDFSMGFGQEGLHRAMAAKKLGIKSIPVVIISTTKRKVRGKLKATY